MEKNKKVLILKKGLKEKFKKEQRPAKKKGAGPVCVCVHVCNLCTLSLPSKEIQSRSSSIPGLSQPRYVRLNLVAIRLQEYKKRGAGRGEQKKKQGETYIWNKISSFAREKRKRTQGGGEGRQTERQVTSSRHHSPPLIAAYYAATIVSYRPR